LAPGRHNSACIADHAQISGLSLNETSERAAGLPGLRGKSWGERQTIQANHPALSIEGDRSGLMSRVSGAPA